MSTASVFSSKMEPSMRANGTSQQASEMAEVCKYGLMALGMRDTGRMIRQMGVAD